MVIQNTRPIVALAVSMVLMAGCGGSGSGGSAPPVPNPVIGTVRVIDGDTIALGEERHRLFGIDAPERGQDCHAMGLAWECGNAATDALKAFVERHGRVACESTETDRYGRSVGRCTSGGRDIGDFMVRNGWALDYAAYSGGAYAGAELEARAEDHGIHIGTFITPSDWRRGERLGDPGRFGFSTTEPSLDVRATALQIFSTGNREEIAGFAYFGSHSVSAIVNERHGLSFGSVSGSNPSLSAGASWSGSAVAVDDADGFWRGDANVNFKDLTVPVVDVRISDLTPDDARTDRITINWEDVVLAHGTFAAEGMAGQFYGPSHLEMGGVFEDDELTGIFGGARE